MKLCVSIPDKRAEALDRVAAKAFIGNRSAAVDAALEPFLRAHGELTLSDEGRILEKARVALMATGPLAVEAALDELLKTVGEVEAQRAAS